MFILGTSQNIPGKLRFSGPDPENVKKAVKTDLIWQPNNDVENTLYFVHEFPHFHEKFDSKIRGLFRITRDRCIS